MPTKVEDKTTNAAALLGRLGGLVKSEAKKLAAQENGKLGGRPPKKKAKKTFVRSS